MPYCASCGTQAAEGQTYCTTCGKEVAAPIAPLAAMPYFPTENFEKIQGYAGFWWRVLAYLIDVIILGIVVAVIASAASISAPTAASSLAVILAFVYGTAFIATRSQTLGMMVTRLRVEGVDGAKVTWNQAAIRTAFYSALLLISDLYHRGKTYSHPTARTAATRDTQPGASVALRITGAAGQPLDAVGQAQANDPRQGCQDGGEALSAELEH